MMPSYPNDLTLSFMAASMAAASGLVRRLRPGCGRLFAAAAIPSTPVPCGDFVGVNVSILDGFEEQVSA